MSGPTGDWARPEDDAPRPDAPPSGEPPPPPPPPLPPPGTAAPPPPPTWGAPPGWGQAPAWGQPPVQQRIGLVPLYPMGVGDVLDTSFKLLRAAALPSVLIVVLILGPIQVLASVAFVSPFEVLRNPVAAEPDITATVLSLVGFLLSILVWPLVAAALTWLGIRTDDAEAPAWTDALRAGARRYLPLLGTFALLALGVLLVAGPLVALIAAAAVFGGDAGGVVAILFGFITVFLVIVAVVAVMILGYLAVPVSVFEQLGPWQTLRRVWGLMRRRFWPVVGVSLLAGLVFTLLGSAVSFVVSMLAFIPVPFSWIFVALGGTLDQMIRAPLGAFAALAIYVDLRIRLEGYDIAVLASELRR